MKYESISWKDGFLGVQSLGAMMFPLCFYTAEGSLMSLLHAPNWALKPPSETDPAIAHLRGDWFCLPFGGIYQGIGDAWHISQKPYDNLNQHGIHGFFANNHWTLERRGENQILCSIDATTQIPDYPIARVEKLITADKNIVTVTITMKIQRDIQVPIGLHPTFRLPTLLRGSMVETEFKMGHTAPFEVDPTRSLVQTNKTFTDLTHVPQKDGSYQDMSSFPLPEKREELLQLCNTQGRAIFINTIEKYAVTLAWNKDHFPHLMLWISNKGREASPWSGKHTALGIEPICSPFGLDCNISRKKNPLVDKGVQTCYDFTKDSRWKTSYTYTFREM